MIMSISVEQGLCHVRESMAVYRFLLQGLLSHLPHKHAEEMAMLYFTRL